MKGTEVLLVLPLWAVILLGVWLFNARRHARAPGMALQITTWAVLSIVSIVYGGVVLFLGCHLLFFAFGTGVAAVGLVASELGLIATPVGWWLVVRRYAHRFDDDSHAQLKR